MHDWKFWEWLAYSGLFIAASMIAIDTGIRLSPDMAKHVPHFFESALWGFLPLALVLIATAILIARSYGWIGKTSNRRWQLGDEKKVTSNAEAEWSPFSPKWNDPLITVTNQEYENETVHVDGKYFINCKFTNVTFRYEGSQPANFTNCEARGVGSTTFSTHNPGIKSMVEMMNALKVTSGRMTSAVIKKDTPR